MCPAYVDLRKQIRETDRVCDLLSSDECCMTRATCVVRDSSTSLNVSTYRNSLPLDKETSFLSFKKKIIDGLLLTLNAGRFISVLKSKRHLVCFCTRAGNVLISL